jgi:hypothetical protein
MSYRSHQLSNGEILEALLKSGDPDSQNQRPKFWKPKNRYILALEMIFAFLKTAFPFF